MDIRKWNFMMDLCKLKGWNPGNKFYWELADKEYENYLKGKHE